MLDKFADELRAQREKSGLTLQQLATKTRIDLKFLEAIDQGNFAFLPDLYVKAFVKQYAKTIGLDENETLKKFEAAREGKDYNLENEQQQVVQEEPIKPEPTKSTPPNHIVIPRTFFENPLEKSSDESKQNSKQNLFYVLAGLGLVVIIILVYFIAFNESDKIIVEETPIEQSIEQKNQRYEEETPTVNNTEGNAAVSTDSLYLTFTATETSWIYSILDDKKVQEFTLSPGSKYTISAVDNFKVTVGNSGGVKIQLNNNPIEFSGRSGSVRYFKINRQEFIYLNAPPKLEQ